MVGVVGGMVENVSCVADRTAGFRATCLREDDLGSIGYGRGMRGSLESW